MDRRRRCRVSAAAALLVAAVAAPAASAQGASVLPMVTYNAHWGEQINARTGHWTGHLDLKRIATDVRRTGAEVALLQELHTYRVGRSVLSEPHVLARLLGWTQGGVRRHVLFHGSSPIAVWCRRMDGRRVVKWINGRPGRCREHGNAILSKRPLLEGRFVDLFRPGGNVIDRDLYGTNEGRGGLRAAMLVDGRRLWVSTTHLAREPAAGTCQLRDLLQQLPGLTPLVLAGDFNMQTDTETPAPRCDGVPPRPLDQPPAVGLTRGEPGGRTYPAHRPVEAIDQFFASSEVLLEAVRPLNNCRGGRCSSDHRPLAGRAILLP